MRFYLLVFDPKSADREYRPFLGSIADAAKKQKRIEATSVNAYMIPASEFVTFVSVIARLSMEYTRTNQAVCGYKCLTLSEDPQWLHFEDFPQ